MTPEQPDTPQEAQPVAYDAEGRPLYHHPVVDTPPAEPTTQSHITTRPQAYEGNNFDPQIRAQYANEPGTIHAARAHEPEVPQMSERLKNKCEQSHREYPHLNLSEGEFVIMSIKRHPIGLFIPVALTMLITVLLGSLLMLYPDIYTASLQTLPGVVVVSAVLIMMLLLTLLGGGIAVWVYLQNQFFLTNESVIQEIQHSLFSRHEQTVSLGSIEDASFKQYGILPFIFNYGLMRLSTEGQETTYRFNYVANPKAQVAIVNNAVEAFKNGRPVGSEYLD